MRHQHLALAIAGRGLRASLCNPSPPHACADGDREMMYFQHVCFLVLTWCWTVQPQQVHHTSPTPSQQKTRDCGAFFGLSQRSSPALMFCTEEPPTLLPQIPRNVNVSLVGAVLAF